MRTSRRAGFAKAAVALIFITMLFLPFISSYSNAAGVVTIYNSPPLFKSINIQDEGTRIVITVDVSDFNGWEDIYCVYVNATDSGGNIVESALYRQYASNGSSQMMDQKSRFSDLSGGFLIPDESDVETFHYQQSGSGGWGSDWFNATHELITFVMKPFSALQVKITAFDRKMAHCEQISPFSSSYSNPPLIDNPTVPLGLSLIIAAGVGSGIYMYRRNSNKMAKLVEEKMRGG